MNPLVPPETDGTEIDLVLTWAEVYAGVRRELRIAAEPIVVNVPPGVDDGMMLRLRGKGPPVWPGGPPTDLYVKLIVTPDPRFERNGTDVTVRASAPASLLRDGGALRVEGPDGPVDVAVPAGTRSGTALRVAGRGLPDVRAPGARGALLVVVEVPGLWAKIQGWRP